jgi:hypothetical protein
LPNSERKATTLSAGVKDRGPILKKYVVAGVVVLLIHAEQTYWSCVTKLLRRRCPEPGSFSNATRAALE